MSHQSCRVKFIRDFVSATDKYVEIFLFLLNLSFYSFILQFLHTNILQVFMSDNRVVAALKPNEVVELARGAIDFAFAESSTKRALHQTFDARAQNLVFSDSFETSSSELFN